MNDNSKVLYIDNILLAEENKKLKAENEELKKKVKFLLDVVHERKETDE